MKHARLVWFALVLSAASAVASLALACDQTSAASASAKSCPASASCPANSAACTGAASAHAASASCSGGASAVTAAAGQCPHASGSVTAVHATSGQCPYAHGAAATAVVAGTAGASHCAASAGTSCGSATATKVTSSHCQGEGLVKMADQSLHTDCESCSDMARCEQEIQSAGGHVQIVQLKNGVMYMYTAESSAGVRAVQAAVSHRNEHLAAWTTAGDRVHLCPECKSMRGAAASGKLTREVVNIEGGCLTLVTSTDPNIVARLHSMAQAAGSRTKI